ncbi:MAG: hypothetical protein Unbinned6284contig1004_7 [Prokaryotic dsDNA virus sp.]|nr:MAG: hypothetical protein Unbinned6284contig1004_7 [Prokaryotic dsDNA virus sp.]|tara:strand:+ start:23523 stop:25547 length:2025 start_codon:yes stop_codon:yes gene_type:complete
MANTQINVNGYDSEIITEASTLPAGSGEKRALVNGYDAKVVYNANGGGGGGSTPEDFFHAYNGNYSLSSTQQYVEVRSDISETILTLPKKDDIQDGHFVVIRRGIGTNSQLVQSPDGSVSGTPDVDAATPPNVKLLLNGDAIDTSDTGSTFTQTSNTSFVTDDFLGQNHEVFEVEFGQTGAKGLNSTFTPATGGNPRTVFFQYKSNGVTVPTDKAGFFGFGDVSSTGKLFALEGNGSSGDLRVHCKNVLIGYPKANFPDIFDGNAHTIAVTSSSSDISSIELYIDDMSTPIVKGGTVGSGSINTADSGITVGYSKSDDKCIPGKYSNFRCYNQVLSSDELNILKLQGVLGANNLDILDDFTDIRVVYNKSEDFWQVDDGVLLRLFDYDNRISSLENPDDSPRYRAVSNTTQTISTSADGSVIQFEVEKDAVDLSLVNGELEFTDGGLYTFLVQLNLDVTSGFSGSVESWVESYNYDTTAWEIIPDSGQIKEADTFNEGAVYYNSIVNVGVNAKLRLKMRSTSGTASLEASTLSNLTSAPSSVISVTKVSDVGIPTGFSNLTELYNTLSGQFLSLNSALNNHTTNFTAMSATVNNLDSLVSTISDTLLANDNLYNFNAKDEVNIDITGVTNADAEVFIQDNGSLVKVNPVVVVNGNILTVQFVSPQSGLIIVTSY